MHHPALDRRAGLNAGVGVLVDALYQARRRGLDRLRRLRADGWAAPSRCAGWSVLDVAEHLVEMTRSQPAGPGELFDPAAARRGRPATRTPAGVVTEMALAVEAEYRALLTRAIPDGDRPSADGWHWSLDVAYRLWDAWLHERDICLPLGLRTRATSGETRLVTLFSILYAAQTAAEVEGRASVRLTLTGAVQGSFVAVATADGATALTAPSPSPLEGDAATVLDALAGRGAALPELFGRSAAELRHLEYARRLTMTGATAAGADQSGGPTCRVGR
jgi:hypothetical protein